MTFASWRHRLICAAPIVALSTGLVMGMVDHGPTPLGRALFVILGVATYRALRLRIVVTAGDVVDHALLWTRRYRISQIRRIRSELFDWYFFTMPGGTGRRQAVLFFRDGRERRVRSVALGDRVTSRFVNYVFDTHLAARPSAVDVGQAARRWWWGRGGQRPDPAVVDETLGGGTGSAGAAGR